MERGRLEAGLEVEVLLDRAPSGTDVPSIGLVELEDEAVTGSAEV